MTRHVTRLYDFLKPKFTAYRNKVDRGNSLIRFNSSNDDFLNHATTHSVQYNYVVDTELLYGVKLILSEQAYTKFRNDFMDRFLTRGIKFQTIDLFILHLNSEVTVLKGMLERVYDTNSYQDLLNGTITTTTDSEGTSTNTNIGTTTSLPQTSNDFSTIDYADNLDKNQGDSKDTGKTVNKTVNTTPETLLALQRYHAKIFETLDTKLFSQLY